MDDIDRFSRIVGLIYDSAIEPAGWSRAFEGLQAEMDLAYVGLNATEFPRQGPPRNFLDVGTPWDRDWLRRLLDDLPALPAYETMRNGQIDQPMVFRQLIPDAEFRRSAFFRNWVEPQGLDDAANTIVLKRPEMLAVFTVWTRAGRRRLSRRETGTLARLGPHLRRALLISGLLDSSRLEGLTGTALLDRLAVAAMLVDPGGKVVHTNAAADALLAAGRHLRVTAGRLRAARPSHAPALDEALRRAQTGADAAMENWGCATVLAPTEPAPGTAKGQTGGQGAADRDMALAYVLPMGESEIRHSLGQGCCAVFAVLPGQGMPPPIEAVSGFLGLTSTESACAILIADGVGTEAAAGHLGISSHTLRKHLANIYDKTGLRDRASLAAAVGRLRLPLTGS